ncbi:MAG TPA: ABC transporter permease [Planctomycetota bacterium]|nr:ABC transporter permease [Planctomycetota bacterium]
MLVPLTYNLRSLFVRRSATLLTVLGIGATVAIVSGVIALQQGFKTMFVAGGHDDIAVFLRPGANSEGDSQFSRELGLKLIKSLPEIEIDAENRPIASMEAYLAVLLPPVRGGVTNVPLRGVQPMTFQIRRDDVRIVAGRNFTPGNDELIVGTRLVDRIEGCRIGEVIQLNKTPFKVVGVFDHEGQFGGEVWGDLDRLMSAMGRYGPNRVVAKLKPGTEIGEPHPGFLTPEPEATIEKIAAEYVSKEEAKQKINHVLATRDWRDLLGMPPAEVASLVDLGASSQEAADKMLAELEKAKTVLDPKPGSLADRLRSDNEVPAKVLSESHFLELQTGALTGILGVLGSMLGLIMGTAAIFTATNTMLSAIGARTHEIGILLAIGYRPVPIFFSFMFEALVLGLIGGLAGCLMALPFNGVKAGTMNFQTFTEMAFSFRVTPFVLGVAISFSLMLGLIGGALPAWRAARMKVTTALRHG